MSTVVIIVNLAYSIVSYGLTLKMDLIVSALYQLSLFQLAIC